MQIIWMQNCKLFKCMVDNKCKSDVVNNILKSIFEAKGSIGFCENFLGKWSILWEP